MKSVLRVLTVGLLLAGSVPALSQGSARSASLELAKKADSLKPGEWLLYPEIAPDGPVLVYVDIGRQRATVGAHGRSYRAHHRPLSASRGRNRAP